MVHFLSTTQAQEADLKPLQFQENVVHSRMGVASQKNTEATSMEYAHLLNKEVQNKCQINIPLYIQKPIETKSQFHSTSQKEGEKSHANKIMGKITQT